MKTCNTQYEDLIRHLVEKQLGKIPFTLQAIPTYPDSIVYQIDSKSGSFIFKAMDPDGKDPDGIALEAWTCEKARQVEVPAPEVILLDTSKESFPSTYFLMRKAEGCPLSELELDHNQESFYVRQLGQHLRQMHTITLDGFGWLDEEDYLLTGAIHGDKPTWRAFLLDDLKAIRQHLIDVDVLESHKNEIVEELLQTYDDILDYSEAGSLLHGDLGSLHVWVDVKQNRLTNIIDFGERKAGDPIWDIVEYDWKSREVLLEGYGIAADQREQFDKKYYLYAVLRAIPWAKRWYAIGGEQIGQWLNFAIDKAKQKLL